MPVNNIMKYCVFVCKKGIKRKYEAHQLNEAIEEVKTGKMTISAASKKFGVPRSTLSDHIHDKVKGPQGGPAMLSKEEEQALVDYMLYMSRHNFPVTRDDIRSTIIVGCPSIYMNYSINKLKNICE